MSFVRPLPSGWIVWRLPWCRFEIETVPEEDQPPVRRPVGAVAGVQAPGRELAEVGAVGVHDEERPPVRRVGGREVLHREDELLAVRDHAGSSRSVANGLPDVVMRVIWRTPVPFAFMTKISANSTR